MEREALIEFYNSTIESTPVPVEAIEEDTSAFDQPDEPIETTATQKSTKAREFAGFEAIALHNASLGYLVFPVDSGKKKASIKKFQLLATRDTTQIMEWAARFPNASCGLLATKDGNLFIDEDDSDRFREGYFAFAGESYRASRSTGARPNHRQGHWLQTDYSRKKLKNITQGKTKDGMFSLRFHNLYVLGEGSQHPSGSLYQVFEDALAIPIPDKVVDYILSLVVARERVKKEDAISPSTSEPASVNDATVPSQFDVILAEPGRNDGVSDYAWHVLQNETTDFDEITQKVRDYNEAHCDPPLGDDEVEAIIQGKKDQPITGANAVLTAGGNKAGGGSKKTEAPPTPENMRETSLFIFTKVEEVAAATGWGFKAGLASTFKVPLTPSFDRVLLWGDCLDSTLQTVNNALDGRGVIFFGGNGSYPISKDYLEGILSWRALGLVNIKGPRMAWGPEGGAGRKESYALDFKFPAVVNPMGDYIVDKAMGATDGWCPLGDPSLIGGPSGGNKTTLIIDLLEAQRKGEEFLGHKTFGRRYIILAADRGINAHLRTMQRMGFDPSTIPIEFLSASARDGAAVQAILQKIEACDPMPEIVFIEGCDMLVSNASKMEVVTPFMEALQKIARHYHIALVGSVGSAKQKMGEGYTAKRDQIFGTIAWGRMSETIITLQYVEGDDTDRRRTLSVLPRNAPAEQFNLALENGRLIVDNSKPEDRVETRPELYWFKAQKDWFTVQDMKRALKMSRATAYRDVQDAYTKNILQMKKPKVGEAKQYKWRDGVRNPMGWLEEPDAIL